MKPSYCFRATKTALVLGLAAALIGHVARGEDEKLVTIAAPKTRSFCSRVVGRLALVAGIALAPTIFYEARRLPQGQRHCGHGIYLDIDKINSLIPADLEDALQNPQENREQISRWLMSELWGDDDNMVSYFGSWFPQPREASRFFFSAEDKLPLRGVCRHKSSILSSVLTHYGIDNDVWVAQVKGREVWHAWVEYRDQSLALDPTDGTMGERDEFRSRFSGILKRSDHPAWWLLKFKE